MAVEPVAREAREVATTRGRWQPAIQEIVTDHEALGRVYFERGDEMELELCDAFGLFFLDVETGSVEGWTWPSRVLPSPGNRFVYFPSDVTPVLYDRLIGRSYTWDASELSPVVRENAKELRYQGNYTNELLGWGAGAEERLVFRTENRYAVVDESMEAVAAFELPEDASPDTWWAHPTGTYLLARSPGNDSPESLLHSVDLSGGRQATVQIPQSPPAYRDSRVQVPSAGDGLAVISWNEDETCTISRFDWNLSLLSEASLPCDWSGIDLSPDGTSAATVTLSVGQEVSEPGIFQRLTTVSVFDAATGEERLRVKGALPSDALFSVHAGRSRWLADSSGLVLDTRADSRIVRIEDSRVGVFPLDVDWWRGLLIPGPDRPDRLDRPFDLYLEYCAGTDDEDDRDGQCRVLSARVVDDVGRTLASARVTLRIVPGSAWDVEPWSIDAVAYNRTSWGLTSDELRLHLNLGGWYESAGYRPSLPVAIDHPPFAALTALEVSGGEVCAHLRDAPEGEAASLACLALGTAVESLAPPDETHYMRPYSTGHIVGSFAYIRTEDGMEGWLPLDSLRWAE